MLGPVRPETQVEIARTEEYKLGIDAPIRMSGDLDGTPGVTLVGPHGRIELDHGVICARRHIHMSPQDAMEFAVRDHDVVSIRVPGERSLVFGDVVVRVNPKYRLDMHSSSCCACRAIATVFGTTLSICEFQPETHFDCPEFHLPVRPRGS